MPAPTAPNLLYIIADEWRAAAVGAAAQDPVHTPNIDRLAADGVRLTNAVSTDPVCSPHRAMLFSGQYAPTNGVTANCTSATAMGLSADAVCWSDLLAAEGYQCGYIGKWHLDPPTEADARYGEGPRADGRVWDTWTPPHRRHGFGFWYAYGCCDAHLEPHYWDAGASIEQRTDVDQWSAEHETDVACRFLEQRDRTRPFALVMSYNPPHMPFHAVPGRYLDRYRDVDPTDLLNRPNVARGTAQGLRALDSVQAYFAAVTGIDEQVGRLLRTLDEDGAADDTLVVVTSDHGEAMGSHARMGKQTWFDESLLVPFIARLPGVLPAGADDVLLGTPDIYPTLMALLGLTHRVPAEVQGVDLSGALRGEADAPRPEAALYAHLDPADATGVARGVRTHRWTFAVQGEDLDHPTAAHLYDNEADPYQMHNLADAEDATRAWLDQTLRRMCHECGIQTDWSDRAPRGSAE